MQVQNPKQQQKPTSLCLSCLFSWEKKTDKRNKFPFLQSSKSDTPTLRKTAKKKKVGAKSITKRFKDVIEISLTMAKS